MSEKTYNISKCSARKSTAIGMFANFQNPQIPEGKKDMIKFQFFLKNLVKSGQTTYSRSINVTT